jgi:NAD(P)-dependent dehydrogenase (short-subunit alcohol dehydrogenase family)
MTDRRITLVTGASKGIGRATAKALSARGHHVIAVARSKGALEALDDEIRSAGGQVTLVPLDLKDGKAIDQLGGALFERFGRLDGLVGNAGVLGTIGTLHQVTPTSFENTIAVNLTANWRLIRSMDPLMRLSAAPRAVFVTSGVVPRPRAFWGPYQASKAGLEALVHAWADENEAVGFRVNLFDPGPTRTEMRAKAMPGEDPDTLPSAEAVGEVLAGLVEESETRTMARIVYRDEVS